MANMTIVLPSKVQVDAAIAWFILKKFGQEKFPATQTARTVFWQHMPAGKTSSTLEHEDHILIDFGEGRFDQHRLGQENRRLSSAHLIAQYLGVDDRADLQHLLEFARRASLEGRGTLSLDPIDRAFGLSGLLTNLNRLVADNPQRVLECVTPLIAAHYEEEHRRCEQLPGEYQELVKQGMVKEFSALQLGKQLKVVFITSDNSGMAGYVRSRAVGADVVIQKSTSGHVNFITKQMQRVQLRKLARMVKLLEAQKNGIVLQIDSQDDLEQPGRTAGLPQWYYDVRTNTLQNGGLQPQGIPATKLANAEIESVTKQGLNIDRSSFENNSRFEGRRPSGGRPQERFGRRRGVVIIE